MKIDTCRSSSAVASPWRDAGVFAGMAGDGGGVPVVARVRIEIGLEDVTADDKAAARAAVRLRVDTRPARWRATHWNEDVQAGAETPVRDDSAKPPTAGHMFVKLVRELGDLLAGYLARQQLWAGDPEALRGLCAPTPASCTSRPSAPSANAS